MNFQKTKALDKETNSEIKTFSKRNNKPDEKGYKKVKESFLPYLDATGSCKPFLIRPKDENVKGQVSEFNEPLKIALSTPFSSQNDLPNRFLDFFQQYCAPVKPDDKKFFKDVIKQCQLDNDLFQVSPSDQSSNRSEAACRDRADFKVNTISEMKKGSGIHCHTSNSDESLLKDKDAKIIDKKSIEDDTSREENLGSYSYSYGRGSCNSNSNILLRCNLDYTGLLERIIKEELEEQDLDLEENLNEPVDDEEDEILSELLKCQNGLKILAAKNESSLQFLLDAAKKDLDRHELDDPLEVSDKEVVKASTSKF